MRENTGNEHELLSLVWKFHCILNTAWPKPGVPEMAGASVFIGTNLFKSLENGLLQIENASKRPENWMDGHFDTFWKAFSHLFLIVSKQDRSEKSARIDEALNLLYFASGILYHRIEAISSIKLDTHPRLTGVEDVPTLLRVCNWTGATGANEMVDEIVDKMNSISNQFRKPDTNGV